MKRFIVVILLIILAAPCMRAEPTQEVTRLPERAERDVYIIPIEGMIEPALLYVIRRGVAEAEKTQAEAIIFVMDTPGGTLAAAEEIIKIMQNISVPTYTFVNKNAISAGAIISLATDHIYMAPGSKIGDAMPIMMSSFGGVQEMPEDLQEKMVSYVSGMVRAAAQSKGHDDQLAEAMVRREMEYKIGDEVICPEGQLLTLTNVEAERKVGEDQHNLLSEGTVENLDHLLETTGLAPARQHELRVTQLERLARFIARLSSVFLIVGLLGIWIEIKTPGFGLPGLVGITSLIIFFWGHHIAGLAGMEDLLIFSLGFALLLIELLLIPGFGVVGFLGILFMLLGLLSAMVEHYPGTPWYQPDWEQVSGRFVVLMFSLAGTVVLAGLLARWLPHTRFGSRLVLTRQAARKEGYASAEEHPELVGQTGTCLTDLHPGGMARINGHRISVISRGDFIAKGSMVRVSEHHGSRIIVDPAPSPSPEAS